MKMEWTKLPTTLITKRYSDYELTAILKFQLVWAINEEQPDEKTCLRYMTKRQFQTAMTYIDSIAARVGDDVSSVLRKREVEKIRYNKNKHLDNFLPADCRQSADSLPNKIREDKIRGDNNIPPISPKGVGNQNENQIENQQFDEFWKLYTPIVSRDGRFVSKGNKKSCLAKFNKIMKEGIEYATIINGLKNYLNYCTENGVCSCGAEVFLNQRRWENDYSRTGTVQSNQSGGLHRQNLDIVEAARQFAEGSETDL